MFCYFCYFCYCFCQSKVDCYAKGLVHHRKGSLCSYLGSAKIQKLDFWSTHHCDIKSAYHQIEVKPEHQWLTAFVWDGGLYQYTRAPFGQKGSGNTFVRAVQQILYPIRDITASFVDDIAVHTVKSECFGSTFWVGTQLPPVFGRRNTQD